MIFLLLLPFSLLLKLSIHLLDILIHLGEIKRGMVVELVGEVLTLEVFVELVMLALVLEVSMLLVHTSLSTTILEAKETIYISKTILAILKAKLDS